MRRTSWLMFPVAGLLAVSAACTSSNKSTSNANRAVETSTAASVAAAATATPNATTAPAAPTSAVHIAPGTPSSGAGSGGTLGGASSAAATPAADGLVAPDCFKSVSAFKYDLTFKIDVKQTGTATPDAGLDLASLLGNIHVTGQFQAPDRTESKFQILGQNYETITIGSNTWTKEGTSDWKMGDSSDNLAGSLTPSDLCQQTLTGLSATGIKPTSEKLDGQNVLRYEFDHEALSRFQDLFGSAGSSATPLPADAKLDLWVTEKEHLPLKMILSGSDTSAEGSYSIDLEFTITDLNGKDINITAPQ